MIIRFQTNRGILRLRVDNDTASVEELLQTPEFSSKYRLDQKATAAGVTPLSLDQSGSRPILDLTKPLSAFQLSHGSMIYGRVVDVNEEQTTQKTNDTDAAAPSSNEGEPSKAERESSLKSDKNKADEVIELLDSDSSDDDDDVKISAKKEKQQQPFSSIEILSSSSSDDEEAENQAPAPARRKSVLSGDSSMKKRPRIDSKAAAAAPFSSAGAPKSFRICTYNVWFGPRNQHPHPAGVHPHARMRAIAQELAKAQAASTAHPLTCIGFQELTQELKATLYPLLNQQGYQLMTQPNNGSYGVGMAVHRASAIIREHSWVPFKYSLQLRGFLAVRTDRYLFCTTHLESFISETNNGSAEREQQILELEAYCQYMLEEHSELDCAIIAGDLNWDDERAMSKRSTRVPANRPLLEVLEDSRWIDAWQQMHGKDTHLKRKGPRGYTYDSRENPMLGGNLNRRLDRVLVLPRKSGKVSVDNFSMIGTEAIPNLTWSKKQPFTGKLVHNVPVAPSDHFGVVVKLSRN